MIDEAPAVVAVPVSVVLIGIFVYRCRHWWAAYLGLKGGLVADEWDEYGMTEEEWRAARYESDAVDAEVDRIREERRLGI